MIQINLLPWRKKQRQREIKKLLYTIFLSALASVGMILTAKFYYFFLINNQINRNQLLQQEINFLNKRLKESELLKQKWQQLEGSMHWINSLLITRASLVHLLDELMKIIPEEIYLIKLEKEGNKTILIGCSTSNGPISSLIRRIERNKWMENPVLNEIKSTEEGSCNVRNQFKLSFTLRG